MKNLRGSGRDRKAPGALLRESRVLTGIVTEGKEQKLIADCLSLLAEAGIRCEELGGQDAYRVLRLRYEEDTDET